MNKEQLKALRTAHELIKTALGPMPGGGGPGVGPQECEFLLWERHDGIDVGALNSTIQKGFTYFSEVDTHSGEMVCFVATKMTISFDQAQNIFDASLEDESIWDKS